MYVQSFPYEINVEIWLNFFQLKYDYKHMGQIHDNDRLFWDQFAGKYMVQDDWLNTDFCKVCHKSPLFKEEMQIRFNLISEERVNNFEQNTENLIEIGWKIRKLWHFEVSQFFKKHFLTSRHEYANEWVDDVIASQFSIHFIHRNDKNFIFQLWVC